jgi:hypothetical protein
MPEETVFEASIPANTQEQISTIILAYQPFSNRL